MKPLHETRRAITGGTGRSGRASIADEDLPKVLSVLSDQLYSNKIAAVIREYSCNGWDAHVEAGIPTRPIDVTLPSVFTPELVIRDFGPGLPEDAVYDVYMMFGKSTKENTNAQKGMFGLGSKAAYAYVTAFTIISYNGGLKTTYSAFIDGEQQRIVAMLSEESLGKYTAAFFGLSNGSTPEPDEYMDIGDLGDEEKLAEFRAWLLEHAKDAETGMEIRVPVQKKDVPQFRTEAQNIYRWFDPKPDIPWLHIPDMSKAGTWLPTEKTQLVRNWSSLGLTAQWTATMGNVAYKVPIDQFKEGLEQAAEENEELGDVLAYIQRASGIMHFGIGEVTPHPSREMLSIDKATRQSILHRLLEIRLGVIKRIEEMITKRDKSQSSWALRMQVRAVLKEANVSRQKIADFELYGYGMLPAKKEEQPKTFSIKRVGWNRDSKNRKRAALSSAEMISRGGAAAGGHSVLLIIQDCDAPAARLRDQWGEWDSLYVLTPFAEDYSYNKAELEALLEQLQVDGIPTRLLSAFDFPAPSFNDGRRKSHYSKDFFTRNQQPAWRVKGSFRWDPHPPEIPEGAVYVELHHFETDIDLDRVRADEVMLRELFGYEDDMPQLIGVKRRRIPRLKGATHYLEWLTKTVMKGLQANKEVRADIRLLVWSGETQKTSDFAAMPTHWDVARLKEAGLSENHPLVALLTKMRKSATDWLALDKGRRGRIKRVLNILESDDWGGRPTYKRLTGPLAKRQSEVIGRYQILAPATGWSGLTINQVLEHSRAPKRVLINGKWETLNFFTQVIDYIKLVDDFDELQDKYNALIEGDTEADST